MDIKDQRDYSKLIWRVGRKVGRTIYAQLQEIPNDSDPLIGVLDTTELAKEAVQSHNYKINKRLDNSSEIF